MDTNIIKSYYSYRSDLTDHSQTPRFLATEFIKRKVLSRNSFTRLVGGDGYRTTAFYDLKKEALALLRSNSKEVQSFALTLTEEALGFPPSTPPQSWEETHTETAEAMRYYNTNMEHLVERALHVVDDAIADNRRGFKRSVFFKNAGTEGRPFKAVIIGSPLHVELTAAAHDLGIPISHLNDVRICGESGHYVASLGDRKPFDYGDTLCDMRSNIVAAYRSSFKHAESILHQEARRGGEYERRWRLSRSARVFPEEVLSSIVSSFVVPEVELYHVHTMETYGRTEYVVLRDSEPKECIISPRPLMWSVAKELQEAYTQRDNTRRDWKQRKEQLLRVQKGLAEAEAEVIRTVSLYTHAGAKLETLIEEVEKESQK